VACQERTPETSYSQDLELGELKFLPSLQQTKHTVLKSSESGFFLKKMPIFPWQNGGDKNGVQRFR